MTLFEIYSRAVPWKGLQPPQILTNVIVKRKRPEIPEATPDDLKALMIRCWAHDPADRPSFSAIAGELKVFSPRGSMIKRASSAGQGSTKSLRGGFFNFGN